MAAPTVFLSNLPGAAHAGTIRAAFEAQGIDVVSVQLLQKGPVHRRHNSGLACVQLMAAADIARSCALLDGRLLHAGEEQRRLIVRANKFEEDAPAYGSCEQQQHEGGGSSDSGGDS